MSRQKNKGNIIFKILISIVLFFGILSSSFALPYYAKEPRTINLGTFYEYTYKIVKDSLDLEEKFIVSGVIDKTIVNRIYNEAKTARLYLKDNLENDRLLKYLKIAIAKGIQEPTNKNAYKDIIKRMNNFLENNDVYRIKGKIIATPERGNAPLTVTLKALLEDESGVKLPKNSIVWYIIEGSKKRQIGTGPVTKYTINSQGKIPIFLEVKSTHRNAKGYRDVLPLVLSKEITIFKKSVNLDFTVNGNPTKYKDTLKFTPEEASYGLVFDPSNTYANDGVKIISTKWTFGNGVERTYEGKPRLERVAYGKAGSYKVKLELKTNENRIVKKELLLYIHKPIAVIETKSDKGFIGDTFTFSAKKNAGVKGAKYEWIIKDIDSDKTLVKGEGATFSYTFLTKGRKKVILNVTDLANRKDNDTKDITILSRPPKANFVYRIKKQNKPNRVFLDGTNSYDPDFGDEADLEYIWSIDGKNVELEDTNKNNSIGYYTFNSIGDHIIKLEVRDSDGMSSEKTANIKIKSLLQVEMKISPEVVPAEYTIRYRAKSKRARIFRWNFGDGIEKTGTSNIVTHKYMSSGDYTVRLTVEDSSGDKNYVEQVVYVGAKGKPKAVADIKVGNGEVPIKKSKVCEGNDAYIIDRKNTFNFSAARSINIDGRNSNLQYSWKVGKDNISGFNIVTQSFTRKFKTLGCIPITLTVISKNNHKMNKTVLWVKVENLPPTLKGISISEDKRTKASDSIVLRLSAIGAKDPDGVIQSYLWYYYTEDDPEPQGFKITRIPNVTMTIPNNNGKYYFVVVLKDSNGAKVSSKDVTGEEYVYEVISDSDNVNTPIINFRVSDNNVRVGERVEFSANVRNIIGQDITKKSVFAWDFDGDGVYDITSNNKNKAKYSYKKSGEYIAKVKVSHNGAVNTRTLKINVSNPLVPDFDYFSIGNKVVFVDQSIGKVERVDWDLGDNTKVKNSFYAIHYYGDSNKTYKAQIKITEATNIKTKEKEVKINKQNKFKYRKPGLHIISFPKIKDDKIVLEKEGQKVYLYLGESRVLGKNFKHFAIDFDTAEDSDADSISDNDIDNIDNLSYDRGIPVEIKLNNSREQEVKIFLIGDDKNEIYEQKNIKIIKNYIENPEEILKKMDKLDLESLTPEQLKAVEEIKDNIKNLESKYWGDSIKRLESLVSSMKGDSRELIESINDFKDYLENITDKNGNKPLEAENIITVLDSLLNNGVSGVSQERLGKYNLLLKVIKDKNFENFAKIKENLDYIRDNENDIEGNKKRAKEIWAEINKEYKAGKIDKEDALNIRAVLKSFAVGFGEEAPKTETPKTEEPGKSGFSFLSGLGLLTTLAWVFGGFLGFILFLLIVFYITYLFSKSRKEENISFADYIIEKTKGKKKIIEQEDETEDIFADLDDSGEQEQKQENSGFNNNIENKEIDDVLASTSKSSFNSVSQRENLEVKDLDEDKKTDEEEVPDWLKEIEEEKKQEQIQKDSEINSGGQNEKQEDKGEIEEKKENLESEEEVPDWLKGVDLSEETKTEEKKEDSSSSEKSNEEKQEDSEKESEGEEKDSKTSLEGQKEEIPDFLGLDEDKQENSEKESEGQEDEGEIPDWLKGVDLSEETKTEEKKEDSSSSEKSNEEKQEDSEIKSEGEEKDSETNSEGQKEEIPDFLGLDEDKQQNSEKESKGKLKKTKTEVPKKKEIKKQKDSETSPEGQEEKGKTNKKDSEKIDKTKKRTTSRKTTKKTTTKKTDDKINNLSEKDLDKITDIESGDVPEWLKQELEKDKKTAKTKDEELPEWLKQEVTKSTKPKKATTKKTTKKPTSNNSKKTSDKETEELWDDGMDIPDWLKNEDKGDSKK